ncbi:3-hydroxyacyl-CoA dehydrogenase family protein [Brevibacillus laterosporus]|nr:3-hydroxyacyl-CoA dehydrogenase family protein [Brevibacillus laterosporus]
MFKKVGVIGGGTMGIDVSIDLLLHGIDVILVDKNREKIDTSKKKVIKGLRFAPMLNKKLPLLCEEQIQDKIMFSTHIEDVNDCDFIIENVTEDWDSKRNVYQQLDKICHPKAYFGVNTSCISITKIASLTSRPQNVIGMHFMNPVYAKSTIEVIKGFHTSEECVVKALALLEQMGKEAIIVNDFPGFVSNRISHLYMNEAAYIVQDQVATPKQVDDIFKKCYGHKMGPLETADLIGLDTVVHSLKILYDSYQDSKFRCCPLLMKMVDAGFLGKKTNQGFYSY